MLITLSVILIAVLVILAAVVIVAGVAALLGSSFKRVFRRGLWFLLLPPLFFLYGMLVERNVYEVSEVSVSSGKVPESFDGYRIVQISDLHLKSFGARHASLRKAVDKINSLSPDLVLFTGDIVTAHPSEMDSLDRILAGVKATDGVYSVLGNHDYCIYHSWPSDSLRKEAVREIVARQNDVMGWKVLMNSNVNISRPRNGEDGLHGIRDTIFVIGVENISQTTYFPSYGDLDKAMTGARGSFKILMTHDPTHWKKAVSEYPDIDLTLSGHTHAMQFSLFGWSPASLMFPEYRGFYRDKDAEKGTENILYVNIGLGETAIPARIGTPPEITLITLHTR